MIVKLLEKLIEKKFYEKKEDIINKCNVFFAMNVISEEDYSNLILKIEEIYNVSELEEEETTIEDTSNDVEEVDE